eukprot:TRINITY_DN65498_c0_g1_i1.p2 TRINITY_DN65498_c0_g1~~TRINITY_DN65498_c0_g1_i1.p2  ORF type:complete len:145 (+),score=12.76 TRINITY_DN65498_c0_g1_i1:1040-1474(+)
MHACSEVFAAITAKPMYLVTIDSRKRTACVNLKTRLKSLHRVIEETIFWALNCSYCPITNAQLAMIPGITECFGNLGVVAFFVGPKRDVPPQPESQPVSKREAEWKRANCRNKKYCKDIERHTTAFLFMKKPAALHCAKFWFSK